MKMNRMSHVAVAGVLGIGLALTGCSGTSGDDSQESQAPADSQAADQTESSGEGSAAGDQESAAGSEKSGSQLSKDADLSKKSPATSAQDAVKTAQDKVEADDGVLHAVELDYDEDDGKWEYDVKIMDGTTDHKVVVDADTGKVVRDESEDSDDAEKSIDLKTPMAYDEAYDLAKDKGEGRLSGWKLEYDDGQREYQFDFDDNGSETEVTVDVESKKVMVD
ncbi:PepSY domain-containing protein [Brevibacterium marinum]|uniref:Putative membrane protein YkoI n=1 Tax=Brevibacterium marinum TaxID=418643 RepID=A0A846RWS3_9MICO|nr:PepSY domain-containing protein [Brevibacterium marinum]NJC56416.1 putative membrane protein YkoI [Brevibacterium marinum]